MPLSKPSVDLAQLYDSDIAIWSEQMADLLRQGKFEQLDLAHLIDEVEALDRRERDRLVSSIRLILHHLLKWQYQPEKRTRSWFQTIQRERINAMAYLEDTPSLARIMDDEWLSKAYRRARQDAGIETGLALEAFPVDCPYGWENILNYEFPVDLVWEQD
jgi:hypothetical protein